MTKREKIEQAIWEKVDTSSGDNACWPWQGSRNRQGYGTLNISGRNHMAHRLVYETLVGGIPLGEIVCHHCDNPCCCNPAHLFTGTHVDNFRDMVRKNRHSPEQLKYHTKQSENSYAHAGKIRVALPVSFYR